MSVRANLQPDLHQFTTNSQRIARSTRQMRMAIVYSTDTFDRQATTGLQNSHHRHLQTSQNLAKYLYKFCSPIRHTIDSLSLHSPTPCRRCNKLYFPLSLRKLSSGFGCPALSHSLDLVRFAEARLLRFSCKNVSACRYQCTNCNHL